MAHYQKQLEHLQRRTETLEKRLGDVYGSLTDLKHAMQDFLYRYRKEILIYQTRLVQVRREITDIYCIKGDRDLRAAGEATTPLMEFLNSDLETVKGQLERVGKRGALTEGVRELDIPPVNPDLLTVYSKLVTRLHPSLVHSTKRERYAPLLQKVNEAYIKRDVVSLNTLHNALNREESSTAISVVDNRVIERMQNHIFDMESLLARLEADLFEIRYGDAAKIFTRYMAARKDGTDLLAELHQQTIKAIKKSVAELTELRKSL